MAVINAFTEDWIFNCPKCPFRSYFANNFWSHSEKHKNELVYCFICPKCFSRTDTETSLNKHLKVCRKTLSDKCKKERKFRKQVKINKNLLNNAYKKNACKICCRKFIYKESLIAHQCTSEHYLMCQKCDYSTHIERLFHLHNSRCHETTLPKKFHGSVIMFLQKWKFKSFSKVKRAQKLIRKPRHLDCNNCKKRFPSLFQLQKHFQQGEHKLQCSSCTYLTCKKIHWHTHNLIAHDVAFSPIFKKFVFMCKQCSFVTTRGQIFQSHLKKCKNTRYVNGVEIGPFECKICKRAFITEKRLKRHSANADHDLYCQLCGYVAKNSKCFSIHGQRHENVKISNKNIQDRNITSSSLENRQEDDFSLPVEDSSSEEEPDCLDIPCPYCELIVKSVTKLKLHLDTCSLYLKEHRAERRWRPMPAKRNKVVVAPKRKKKRRYSNDENFDLQIEGGSTSDGLKGYHQYSLRERKQSKVPLYEEKSDDELLSSTDEYVPSEHEDVDDDDDFTLSKKSRLF